MKIVLTSDEESDFAELSISSNGMWVFLRMIDKDREQEYGFNFDADDWISLRNYIDQRMGLDKKETEEP